MKEHVSTCEENKTSCQIQECYGSILAEVLGDNPDWVFKGEFELKGILNRKKSETNEE